jgi:outer membrane receptor protein involved in Fe transport
MIELNHICRKLLVMVMLGTVAEGRGWAATPGDQGSDQTSQESTVEPRTGALTEIVVTARRREEKLDKVPISITALSQRTMDDLSIVSVSDLQGIVPGLNISPPSNYVDNSNIAIRGIYQQLGTAPTTQLYIDETPIAIRQLSLAYSKSPFPNIFDLDHVEVLRGPQGTLFGASAMGGAIRFITPQPSLNDSSGSVKGDVSYTDGGQPNFEVAAAYGSPVITGSAGFRVSAWYQALGGFIDQQDPITGETLRKNFNTSKAYVIGPAFGFSPVENLTITAGLFDQYQHMQSPNSYWINYLPSSETDHHAWGSIEQPWTEDLKVWSLSIVYASRGLQFVSDTSYLDRTSEAVEDITHLLEAAFVPGQPVIPAIPEFTNYLRNNAVTHAWQQEFRLSGGDSSSRLNWVVGAYYRNAWQTLQQVAEGNLEVLTQYCCGQTPQELFGYPDPIYNGQAVSSYGHYTARDIAEALFTDVTIGITERVKLDLGVRYEHDLVEDQVQLVAGNSSPAPIQVTNPDATGNPVTPRVSLTYQLSDTSMVYASAAKGYRPGAGNNSLGLDETPTCRPSLDSLGLSSVPSTFKSDNLWNYELGSKAQLLNRRVSIEASVYYTRWTDIQTSVLLESCASAFTANQGSAISRGFDLQLKAAVTSDLVLGASVGYTDAYYPNASYGGVSSPGAQPPLLNAAGDKIPNVLPWTVSANAQYSWQMDRLPLETRPYIRLDYRWVSAATPLPSNNPNVYGYDPELTPFPDPAYGVLNVRLGATHEGMDISFYINNVTNSDPRLGYYHEIPGDPLFLANAIRPRTFGVTAWYRF